SHFTPARTCYDSAAQSDPGPDVPLYTAAPVSQIRAETAAGHHDAAACPRPLSESVTVTATSRPAGAPYVTSSCPNQHLSSYDSRSAVASDVEAEFYLLTLKRLPTNKARGSSPLLHPQLHPGTASDGYKLL